MTPGSQWSSSIHLVVILFPDSSMQMWKGGREGGGGGGAVLKMVVHRQWDGVPVNELSGKSERKTKLP